jgi:Na+/proline symporter
MYPLFVTETLGRFPGLTGLFVACILSATLSTFSSGVNSMATVIVEDIYKRLASTQSMSNARQVSLSKILCEKNDLRPFSTVFSSLASGVYWLFNGAHGFLCVSHAE